jgi:hypothetical protein
MLLTIHQGKIVSNHHLALLNHPPVLSDYYYPVALILMNLNSKSITYIVEQTKAQLQEDKILTPH